MADPQSVAAEASQQVAPGLTPSNAPTPSLVEIRSPSHNQGPPLPLPEGRWTFPIHGNCPRCCHHHSAAQVEVEITKDDSQVSWVNCERCKERWAAIGGRNATTISLLSETTSDADSIERQVRLHLIDIVRMATEAASLGASTEQPSNAPSDDHHIEASSHNVSSTVPSPPSPTHIVAAEDEQTAKLDFQQQSTQGVPRPATPITTSGNNSGLHRRLSSLKGRITAHLPILHRANLRQMFRPSKQPKMSPRQIEKSPARTPPAHDHVIDEEPSNLSSVPEVSNDAHVERLPPPPRASVHESSLRFKDVATFIRSLDQSALKTMNDKQRAAWMREHYTEFKVRNRVQRASLSISEVFHTSIPVDPSYGYYTYHNRLSADVRGIGTGLDRQDWHEAHGTGQRQGSLSISDRFSEASTVRDDITVASFPRYSPQDHSRQVLRSRTQRPLSLQNNSTRSSPHLRQLVRQSLPMFLITGTRGTSTTRGQASVRLSQGSTFNRSPLSSSHLASE